jgi:hypothetical protein
MQGQRISQVTSLEEIDKKKGQFRVLPSLEVMRCWQRGKKSLGSLSPLPRYVRCTVRGGTTITTFHRVAMLRCTLRGQVHVRTKGPRTRTATPAGCLVSIPFVEGLSDYSVL